MKGKVQARVVCRAAIGPKSIFKINIQIGPFLCTMTENFSLSINDSL